MVALPDSRAQGQIALPVSNANEVFHDLESAINRLVEEFIREPYLHRCEHSIHFELFHLLKEAPSLRGLKIPLAGGYFTQPVHKEWPEYREHLERGRRGNYDLAVIGSDGKLHTMKEFCYGRIRPLAAIEVGLNYCVKHLRQDAKKLNESLVERGYLIHLATGPGRQTDVEQAIVSLIAKEGSSKVKVVYANTHSFRRRFIGEPLITDYKTQRQYGI